MSVVQSARTLEGNVGCTAGLADVVSFDDSSRWLPTDANGNFVGASGVQL